MSFSVNETVFLGEIDTSDKVTIKSYNKNYEVVYSKQPFLEIVKNIYKPNDFIIIDQNVYNLYKNVLNDIDSKYYYIFDAIENNKNIDSVLCIIDVLYKLQFNKKNKLIVIGGGITQDISGFVSAIYKRGLNWTFIPTTLLSMTDSAIGGKVGINRNSKNLLALFVSPSEIIVSTEFLNTLKDDDIVSGLGESLKLSLIGGSNFYNYFKENFKNNCYKNIIKMSTSVKKLIVEKDELESNERKVLNYGHTLGHALESASNYYIPHGIAVLFGMLMINILFYKDKYEEINNDIIALIPNKFKKIKISYNDFIGHVLNDKKNNGADICFILMDDIGKFIFTYKKMYEIEDRLKNVFDGLFVNDV
jgi:3-dehydroquinate synthase